jgi:acyl-coenzyme A synthetase/AMP-(fatty) acid ligase
VEDRLRRTAVTSPTHPDPVVRDALREHVGRWAEGWSVLVSPPTAYDGLARVRDHVVASSAAPVLVTGLDGRREEHAGEGDGEPVLGFHTSGSTGSPKCVVYAATTNRAHAEMVARSLALDESRTSLALPPSQFAYGLSILHSHAVAGAPVHVVPTGPTPAPLAEALAAHPATDTVYLLPQQVTLLLAAADAARALRRVVVAGGRLSHLAASALAARWPDLELVVMYGQAELGPRLATWRGPVAEHLEGLVGQPVEGVRLALGDPDAEGRTELLAATPYAMRELWRAPYAEPEAGPAAGALVHTGDHARLTGRGWVHVGRTLAFANVAGTRVDLARLQECVEAAVPTVAVRLGTRRSRVTGDDVVVVQVVPEGGTAGATWTATDLRCRLSEDLGGLAALLDLRVVDHLEVAESGK